MQQVATLASNEDQGHGHCDSVRPKGGVEIYSLDHLDGFIRVWERLRVELEVTHPLLPVVIQEEVAIVRRGPGLLPTQPLLGTDGLFDVSLEGLVREGFIRWNLPDIKIITTYKLLP